MTNTARLNLRRPASGSSSWGNALNLGFGDADDRLLKISSGFLLGATQIETPVFVGTGLNDLSKSGTFTGLRDKRFTVRVVATAPSPDTFEWSMDGGVTWSGPFNMSAGPVALADGVSVFWAAVDGHTVGDLWKVDCRSLEREDPNNIDGNGAALAVDFVGQRYLHELDANWWVATDNSPATWERESLFAIGPLSDRPPLPTVECVYVDESTGYVYSFAVATGQWSRRLSVEVPPPSLGLRVLRSDGLGNILEYGPALYSPTGGDAGKALVVNPSENGYQPGEKPKEFFLLTKSSTTNYGGGSTELAIYSAMPVPGGAGDGSRRVLVRLDLRYNFVAGSNAAPTLRIRSGVNGDLTDAIVHSESLSAGPGNFDRLIYAFLQIPLNATKMTISFTAAGGWDILGGSPALQQSDYFYTSEVHNF